MLSLRASHTLSSVSIRPALVGLLLGVVTLLFGFLAGVVFGLNEDMIRDRLSASAAAVESTVYKQIAAPVSIALGAGGLGYSIFWMWAGFRAPGLGSTDLAKESLAWLAIPSSGAVVAATCAVAILLAAAIIRPLPAPVTVH